MIPTIDWFEGPREALAHLFAEADESPEAVSAYRELGRVLVARDGGTIVGHLQLVELDGSDASEVKSLAVRKDRQGEGIGLMLLERVAAVCREERRSPILVATSAADTRVLRFYQQFGFRLVRVERDAFTPEAGYPESDVDGILTASSPAEGRRTPRAPALGEGGGPGYVRLGQRAKRGGRAPSRVSLAPPRVEGAGGVERGAPHRHTVVG